MLLAHLRVTKAEAKSRDVFGSALAGAKGDLSKIPASTRAQRERWDGVSRESWRRLDRPERDAWTCWNAVRDQVHLIQPFIEDAEDAVAVLSLEASDRVMEWHAIPSASRARVWDGMLLLHDFAYHKGRDHRDLCWHHDEPLALVKADCRACVKRWRCSACLTPFVAWHDCEA